MNLFLTEAWNHEWCFVYPDIAYEYDQKIDESMNLAGRGQISEAGTLLLKTIKEFPIHIDSYHHLALLYEDQGFNDIALQLWETATNIGLACFPSKFKTGIDLLEYSRLSNRPFLRAYHGLGLAYLNRETHGLDILRSSNVERALSIFENMLIWSPNDNMGARLPAIDCNFELRRPEEIIKICDKFPEDILGELLYSRALALLQLHRIDEAECALEYAIEQWPLIAKEIVSKNHKNYQNIKFTDAAFGSEEEAHLYWKSYGKYWQETKGSLKLIRKLLKRHKKSSDPKK